MKQSCCYFSRIDSIPISTCFIPRQFGNFYLMKKNRLFIFIYQKGMPGKQSDNHTNLHKTFPLLKYNILKMLQKPTAIIWVNTFWPIRIQNSPSQWCKCAVACFGHNLFRKIRRTSVKHFCHASCGEREWQMSENVCAILPWVSGGAKGRNESASYINK